MIKFFNVVNFEKLLDDMESSGRFPDMDYMDQRYLGKVGTINSSRRKVSNARYKLSINPDMPSDKARKLKQEIRRERDRISRAKADITYDARRYSNTPYNQTIREARPPASSDYEVNYIYRRQRAVADDKAALNEYRSRKKALEIPPTVSTDATVPFTRKPKISDSSVPFVRKSYIEDPWTSSPQILSRPSFLEKAPTLPDEWGIPKTVPKSVTNISETVASSVPMAKRNYLNRRNLLIGGGIAAAGGLGLYLSKQQQKENV